MSEQRAILEDAVARLFGEQVTPVLLSEAETGVWPASLWDALDAAGFPRAHLPESAGGAGGAWSEAFVVLRACGRHAVPLPVAETALAVWLLAAAGLDAPPGPLTVLPDPVPPAAIAGGRLTHRAERVPWGRAAPLAVFVTSREDALEVGLVATSAASATGGYNLAREPRDALAFEAAPLRAVGATALPGGILPLLGALARSAQMAGALRGLLEESVRHAGLRVQFGRPIGRFQVIQHELARLAGHAAAAEVAAEAAFAALDHAAPSPRAWKAEADPSFEIAVAKVRAGEAADAGAPIAHQVHGAIGFTYEHALHFKSRRLWAWRNEFGSENHWAERLGRTALALGADGLWPFVASR